MKRRLFSKAILVLCLLFVLVLAGCDLFAGIFDPLIGSWVWSYPPMSVTYGFHADNSWDAVMSQTGYPDQTVAGTYTHDTKAGTLDMTATSGGSGTQSYTYTISSDRKTLTLTQGSTSEVLTRK